MSKLMDQGADGSSENGTDSNVQRESWQPDIVAVAVAHGEHREPRERSSGSADGSTPAHVPGKGRARLRGRGRHADGNGPWCSALCGTGSCAPADGRLDDRKGHRRNEGGVWQLEARGQPHGEWRIDSRLAVRDAR